MTTERKHVDATKLGAMCGNQSIAKEGCLYYSDKWWLHLQCFVKATVTCYIYLRRYLVPTHSNSWYVTLSNVPSSDMTPIRRVRPCHTNGFNWKMPAEILVACWFVDCKLGNVEIWAAIWMNVNVNSVEQCKVSLDHLKLICSWVPSLHQTRRTSPYDFGILILFIVPIIVGHVGLCTGCRNGSIWFFHRFKNRKSGLFCPVPVLEVCQNTTTILVLKYPNASRIIKMVNIDIEWVRKRLKSRVTVCPSVCSDWQQIIEAPLFCGELCCMMTSCNGNVYRIICPFWGESTVNRWIPDTKDH